MNLVIRGLCVELLNLVVVVEDVATVDSYGDRRYPGATSPSSRKEVGCETP